MLCPWSGSPIDWDVAHPDVACYVPTNHSSKATFQGKNVLSEEENKVETKEPEKVEKKSPGWIRPVSYGLLLAALFFTVTYDRFSDGTGSWRTVLQILAIGCLIIGAALFFSVKEKRK